MPSTVGQTIKMNVNFFALFQVKGFYHYFFNPGSRVSEPSA